MPGKQVLLIEDNELNMLLATELLQFAGFAVLQAGTAEEGIRLAKQNRPDLILMDIALPGMDGLSATRVLKAEPETNHIPIVAMTAHAMLGDKEKALAAGCNGYITKPIDALEFANTVARYILA
ncbi:MAG: response regulator [Myxococcales bacterium]|nr:response regulator [Myxococcales bacterium]